MASRGFSTRLAGLAGEQLAAEFLRGKKYEIVERNFRKCSGEVDIIAVDGGTIVFCEVKSWERMPMGGLEQALDHRKQGRIVRTSLCFLHEHPEYTRLQPRFDVLFVRAGQIVHMENAFPGHGTG